MKLFNTPLKKIATERFVAAQKKLALWLQEHSKRIPVRTQQILLVIFCMLITVYCILLILQPFIN